LKVFIKVGSYFALSDREPKRYYQRRHLPSFVVNIDKCLLLNLVDYIDAKYIWGSKQYITLWRSLLNDVVIEIKSDEQLLEWFELNIESGIICVDAEIKDFDGPLQFSPSKRRCHPKVRERMSEAATNEPLNSTSPCQPTQNESATNEATTNESAKKKSITNKSATKSKVDDVLSDSSYDSDLVASSDDDSDLEFNANYEIVDEDDVDDVHVFSYDQDNLEIKVGVVFSYTKECKSAVLHHAVLHDHAFHTVKMDTSRFTARCIKADEGCSWRFHASTGKGYTGCKVNSYMFLLVTFTYT
jgi:hypothetical protein